MPFGLRNAGATYHWCMQFFFKEQIGRNLEVYVDDITIKSRKSGIIISDLEETFRVPRRKLLGYIITERGIETNSDKISTIARMVQARMSRTFNDSWDSWRPSAGSCPG
jgi:hypothetical protein